MYPFYEKVFYLDMEQKYPRTKESVGHFLGVTDNIGDALTFVVLAQNKQILVRSIIRSAVNNSKFGFPNKHAIPDDSKTDPDKEVSATLSVPPLDNPTLPLFCAPPRGEQPIGGKLEQLVVIQ